jgi:hypothetical protein
MKAQKGKKRKLIIKTDRLSKANKALKLVKDFPPAKSNNLEDIREYEWRAFN